MKKKLLFVCLGNICRSPAAEAICSYKLKKYQLNNYCEVDSAGTGAWHVGKKSDSRMRSAALSRGIIIESRARQITLDDFNAFDLILTMDNSNFADVESLSRELKMPFKAKIQPLLQYSNNTDSLEVPDPYYGGEKGFEDVLDLLDDAIEQLLVELRKF
ncbi:low molecular weight protein-tyrosine-phosphatase [Prochlorococcus marinus]|uniref:low molecular weight protein-tyrosine-phosphatase n=1 Tax=Prochlorococcus marinus TaxID=1219 RepID=UPI0022B48B1E|nr:low molecular weight protein-tyrosine-phosphatase [Prochlorococcus marinus]